MPVCSECLNSLKPLEEIVCFRCGERLREGETAAEPKQAICLECMRHASAFTRAAAFGSYEGAVRDLIHLLKYDHVHPAAPVLGRMLAEVIANLAADFGDRDPVLVPVPLHSSRLRERGFNQAEVIARRAAKLHPAGRKLTVRPSVLRRNRETITQTGLTRTERQANVRGAFTVTRPDEVKGRDIVLVDDVFTTGTTLSECAYVLHRAGAKRIWVATVARVLKKPTHSSQRQQEDEQLRVAS